MANEFIIKNGYISKGNSIVEGGFTATTISATTYQNLPTDIRVTGATYSNNTFTYTNNTGGTFDVLFNTVTGLTVNGTLFVSGTTNNVGNVNVTGNTSVNGSLTVTNSVSSNSNSISSDNLITMALLYLSNNT